MQNDNFFEQNNSSCVIENTVKRSWFTDEKTRALKFISACSGIGIIVACVFLKLASLPLSALTKAFSIELTETSIYILESLCVFIAIGFAVVLIAVLIKGNKSLKKIELFPLDPPVSKKLFFLSIPAGVVLCLTASYAATYIMLLLKNVIDVPNTVSSVPDGTLGLLLFFLRTAFVPAIMEELLFRGALLQPLRRYGDVFAIVMTSLFFGLMHGNLSQVLFAIPAGMVMAYFTIKTGTLWASICIHFFNNFMACIEAIVVNIDRDFTNTCFKYFLSGLFALGLVSLILFFVARKRGFPIYSPWREPGFDKNSRFKRDRFFGYIGTIPMVTAIILLVINVLYSLFGSSFENLFSNTF